MTKKTLGYVELEWTCPACGAKNAGFDRLCKGCGAAQPDDAKFEQAAQESLLSDQAEIELAKAGPDVHCRYCGARNTAGAATCRQCGADLTEGAARESGRVLGAHRARPAEPVLCPTCGTPNDPNARQCATCGASLAGARPSAREPAVARPVPGKAPSNKVGMALLIGAAAVACIVVVIVLVLAGRTKETIGQVEGVQWTRTIGLEALQPVTHETWYDEIPPGVTVGACAQKYHHTESEPVPNSKEVCGTPYTVDTGSGAGQVVQDCEYQVYVDWCKYTADEWQQIDAVVSSGRNLFPQWPGLTLAEGQREGQSREEYQVVFTTDKDAYTYQTQDVDEFLRYQPGSRWVLEINTFNQLKSVSPAD